MEPKGGWEAYRNAADDPREDEPGVITHPSQKPDQRMISPEEDEYNRQSQIREVKKLTPREFAECNDLCDGE